MNQSSKLTLSSNKRNSSNQQRDRPILTNHVRMDNPHALQPVNSTNIASSESKQMDDDMEHVNAVVAAHGYTLVRKLRDTLQGCLYEAIRLEDGKRVSIKAVSKHLHASKTARPDCDGTQFVVAKNILLESITLYHLKLLNNSLCSQYVANFIHFFETSRSGNDRYFLVTEYAGDMSLRAFIQECHALIHEQRLSLTSYRKVVKYMFWQITVVIFWLHKQGACHLNLHIDNIMVQNVQFTELDSGEVKLDPHIDVKVVDFGMAVMMDTKSCDSHNTASSDNNATCDEKHAENGNPFLCDKFGFTENEVFVSPQQLHDEMYDARKADSWALGLILFQLLTDRNPYKMPNLQRDVSYYELSSAHQDLARYRHFLNINGFARYLSHSALTVVVGLLNFDEPHRWSAEQAIGSLFLAPYFRRYKETIAQLSVKHRNRRPPD